MSYPDFYSKGPTPCSETDPESFFPDMEVPGALTRANEAKKVCKGCPYITECLEYALEHNDDGIWGGTSKNERRKIKILRVSVGARTRSAYTRVPQTWG
jgi:WhiB family redox-sensing transcriptional regulator